MTITWLKAAETIQQILFDLSSWLHMWITFFFLIMFYTQLSSMEIITAWRPWSIVVISSAAIK